MERLTKRVNGVATYTDPSCPHDTGLIAEEMKASDVMAVLARLADYEDTGVESKGVLTSLELAKVCAAMLLLKRYQALGTAEELTELVQAREEDRLVVLHKGTTNGLIRKILKLCERANGAKARKGQEVEPLITWKFYNILCKEFGADDLETEALWGGGEK